MERFQNIVSRMSPNARRLAVGAAAVGSSTALVLGGQAVAEHLSAPHAPPKPVTAQPLATPTPVPAPTATRTPEPTPTPTPVPVRRPPPPPPPSHASRNWLWTDNGAVNTAVGIYTDCSGKTELQNFAVIDTCLSDPSTLWFAGHRMLGNAQAASPGPFDYLPNQPVGSVIHYVDANGVEHNFRIIRDLDWLTANGIPAKASPNEVARFQTCINWSGSEVWIIDTVPA